MNMYLSVISIQTKADNVSEGEYKCSNSHREVIDHSDQGCLGAVLLPETKLELVK